MELYFLPIAVYGKSIKMHQMSSKSVRDHSMSEVQVLFGQRQYDYRKCPTSFIFVTERQYGPISLITLV